VIAPVLRLLLRCARILPPAFAWWAGRGLGATLGSLPLRDARRAREHLARAFPERPAAWHRATALAAFAHISAMALWTLTRLGCEGRSLGRGVAVEGGAHLRQLFLACARRQGTVVFTGHFGNWEMLSRLSGAWLPTAVVGRRLRDARLDAVIKSIRTATGAIQIDQQDGPRPCLRALRDGRLLACLADQDIPRLRGVFVPWFGIDANTPAGPATLAVLAGVAAQPVFCYRRGGAYGDGRWVIHFGPRRAAQPGLGREAAVQELTAWATAYQEALVRRAPGQWVWWHRRWRTRPNDPQSESPSQCASKYGAMP
jgi:KDO2-lipid IV(A) lauroyltransferase